MFRLLPKYSFKNFRQKCSRVFVVLIAAKATAWAMHVYNKTKVGVDTFDQLCSWTPAAE